MLNSVFTLSLLHFPPWNWITFTCETFALLKSTFFFVWILTVLNWYYDTKSLSGSDHTAASEFRLSHIRFGGRKKRKKEDEGVSFLERDTKDLTEQRSSSSPERSCPAARLHPSPPPPSIKTHGAGFYWGLTLTDWLTSAIFMCVCVCVWVCVCVGVCVGYVHLKAASVSIDKQESERSCYRVKSK